MDHRSEQQFAAFVTDSGARLLAFARLLIADRGDAEDALQVALMRLMRHWDRGIEAPEPYVRRALVNVARDRGRRRHLVPTLTRSGADSDLPVFDETPSGLVRESLDALLDGLPRRQRVTVVLRVVEGYSEAETAELMGCAAGTAKSNLARGLERLRRNHAERVRDRPEMPFCGPPGEPFRVSRGTSS